MLTTQFPIVAIPIYIFVSESLINIFTILLSDEKLFIQFIANTSKYTILIKLYCLFWKELLNSRNVDICKDYFTDKNGFWGVFTILSESDKIN